jgi:hypothetical protein
MTQRKKKAIKTGAITVDPWNTVVVIAQL